MVDKNAKCMSVFDPSSFWVMSLNFWSLSIGWLWTVGWTCGTARAAKNLSESLQLGSITSTMGSRNCEGVGGVAACSGTQVNGIVEGVSPGGGCEWLGQDFLESVGNYSDLGENCLLG